MHIRIRSRKNNIKTKLKLKKTREQVNNIRYMESAISSDKIYKKKIK